MDAVKVLVELIPGAAIAGILLFAMFLAEREAAARGAAEGKRGGGRRLRALFVSAAVVTLAGSFVSSLLGSGVAYFCFLVLPLILVVVLYLSRSKAGRFVAVLLVLFAGLGVYLSRHPVFRQAHGDLDVTLTDSVVEIGGSFGEDIRLADIAGLRLVDSLPAISLRTFGYSAAGVNLGRFRAADGRTVWLHTYSTGGKAVRIDTRDGREIYINSRDSLRTKAVYADIDSLLQTVRQ